MAERNFCQKPKKVQDLDAVVLEELSRLKFKFGQEISLGDLVFQYRKAIKSKRCKAKLGSAMAFELQKLCVAYKVLIHRRLL